jgi:hypothetical protein
MDDATRLDLWEALSDLFRDTEVTDLDIRHIARVIRASGVPVPEVEAILWNEVFPVLHPNLRSVTGVWTGWSREWLRAHLQPSAGPPRPRGPRSAIRDIRQEWERVRAYLTHAEPPPSRPPYPTPEV